MKVVFLQNIDGIAGSERYFLAIIPALIEKGISVEMCCVVKNTNREKAQHFIDLLVENEITYSMVYCSTYASPLIPKKINARLKAFDADILHCHLIYADVWGAAIKKFLNKSVKVISTKHGYHESTYVKHCTNPAAVPKNLYYYLFRYSHKTLDASYACSYGLVDFYTKVKLIGPNEMSVIQHGFDYPELSEYETKDHRFSPQQLIITGRLIERKGHHFIFNIMPKLVEKFPDIKLVVMGNGDLKGKLLQLAANLNMEEHIVFTGFQSNVVDYLRSSDLMLMTSYSEGLPLVIFEAFNAKTPVITFDTIGSNELVRNEETGVVVPAFDTNKLAVSIVELLENPIKAAQLAKQAHETLKSKFSLARMTNETIEFYKDLFMH